MTDETLLTHIRAIHAEVKWDAAGPRFGENFSRVVTGSARNGDVV
jgi:hypothetical protein